MKTSKSEVAISVPFDNSTNFFTATNAQQAIEEARNTVVGNFVSDSSTVSTTSSTFAPVGGMTLTVTEPGGYIIYFECDAFCDGAGAAGEIALFRNGTEIATTRRRHELLAAGISLATIEVRTSLVSFAFVTLSIGDSIQAGFREMDNDVFYLYGRSLHFIKVRP